MIRTSTLRALREDIADSDRAAQTYSDEAEKWHQQYTEQSGRADGLQAVVRQTSRELGEARAEVESARAQVLLDAEDRVALRALLRAARAQARAGRVYVLWRHGRLHSLHATSESAEAAAEAEGAPRGGWMAEQPGAAQPPASEVPWRVQALPLGGSR